VSAASEKIFEKIIERLYKTNNYLTCAQNSHFCMLKLNIKLLIDPPPPKLTMAHLSPSVDRDRRPLVFGLSGGEVIVIYR